MDFPDVQHQRAVVVCMDSGCLRNSSSVSRAAAAFTGDEGSLGSEMLWEDMGSVNGGTPRMVS